MRIRFVDQKNGHVILALIASVDEYPSRISDREYVLYMNGVDGSRYKVIGRHQYPLQLFAVVFEKLFKEGMYDFALDTCFTVSKVD